MRSLASCFLAHPLKPHTLLANLPPLATTPAQMDPNSEGMIFLPSSFFSTYAHSAAAKIYGWNALFFFQTLIKLSLSFPLTLFLNSFINGTASLRREPSFPGCPCYSKECLGRTSICGNLGGHRWQGSPGKQQVHTAYEVRRHWYRKEDWAQRGERDVTITKPCINPN